jgi:hypothetical protein
MVTVLINDNQNGKEQKISEKPSRRPEKHSGLDHLEKNCHIFLQK